MARAPSFPCSSGSTSLIKDQWYLHSGNQSNCHERLPNFQLVDGQDIRDFNLQYLRRHIGLVTQEPTLFACSLAENIAYGEPNIQMGKIIQAAKTANIHHFIANLPNVN